MEYTILSTWLGEIRVVFVPDPFRIERIQLPDAIGSGMMDPESRTRISRCPDASFPSEMRVVGAMLQDYFDTGRPMEPPWEWLPLKQLRPLQQKVLRVTAAIPYGQLRTYKDIAVEMGKPAAARYVGNALAANPWPLLIACHRVIRSNGGIGGFGGGTDMKAKLIAHENGGKHPVLAHRC